VVWLAKFSFSFVASSPSFGPVPPTKSRLGTSWENGDLSATLLRQLGAFLDANTIVHYVLRGVTCCRNELRVVLLNRVHGIGQHLGYVVDATPTG